MKIIVAVPVIEKGRGLYIYKRLQWMDIAFVPPNPSLITLHRKKLYLKQTPTPFLQLKTLKSMCHTQGNHICLAQFLVNLQQTQMNTDRNKWTLFGNLTNWCRWHIYSAEEILISLCRMVQSRGIDSVFNF